MANCKSCGAKIEWFKMATTGRPMPVDAEPLKVIVPTGTAGEGKVVTAYVSHFATCPDAAEHRKRRTL